MDLTNCQTASVTERDFDVDRFLARALTARLATTRPGVRPVWFLWEDGRFWILVGPWNRIVLDVIADPNVALVVDTCDLTTGECLQVVVRGRGELVPFDHDRGARMMERYVGPDHSAWDPRFRRYLTDEPEARWLLVIPTSLVARDLSFVASGSN